MKKFISLFLILTLCFSLFAVNVSAFGGYAHWYMGTTIVSDSAFDDKADDVKLAFISGCFLADIGESTWNDNLLSNGYIDTYNDDSYNKNDDLYKTESDLYLVTNKLYELSRSLNARSRAMAYGWRDHYIQDELGSVANINSPHLTYRNTCAWIDEYLRDEVASIDYPIQSGDTSAIYVGYTLIKNTYNELYGLNLDNDDIITEIVDLFNICDMLILTHNGLGWTQSQRLQINTELTRTMDLCYGIKASTPIFLRGASSTSSSNPVSYNRINLVENQIKDSFTEKEKETLANYVRVEEDTLSKEDAILYLSITDEKEYNRTLEIICNEKLKTINQNLVMK